MLKETKDIIRARIEEVKNTEAVLKEAVWNAISNGKMDHDHDAWIYKFHTTTSKRLEELEGQLESAEDCIEQSIVNSHRVLCKAKNMDENAGFGNEPSVFYALAIAGEAGEMCNALVKALRNGFSQEKAFEAVKSELHDIVIYSYVLAHVLKINLTELVREKTDVIVQRAKTGYYGKPF